MVSLQTPFKKRFQASNAREKRQKSWRLRAALKTLLLLDKAHCSGSKSLKIHIFVFKVGTDVFFHGHQFFGHLSRKESNRSHEIWVSKETNRRVFCREWSNEKPNFSKTPKFALKPLKLPEGPL